MRTVSTNGNCGGKTYRTNQSQKAKGSLLYTAQQQSTIRSDRQKAPAKIGHNHHIWQSTGRVTWPTVSYLYDAILSSFLYFTGADVICSISISTGTRLASFVNTTS